VRRLVRIVLVLLILVLAYFAFGRLFERRSVDARTIEESVERLEVDVNSGSVTVRASDRDDIRVRTVRTYAWFRPRTDARIGGDELHLTGTCRLLGQCSVSYEVDLPRGTELDLETSAGRIRISGATGAITAKTSAGDIEGDGLAARRVEAQTSAGDIDLTLGEAPERLELRTSAGDIDVVAPDETYDVDADTSAGEVDTELRTDPDAPRVIEARTSAGDISLRRTRQLR
jgi:DUF4097 and DUF4098 domain-containing protein YvlB